MCQKNVLRNNRNKINLILGGIVAYPHMLPFSKHFYAISK